MTLAELRQRGAERLPELRGLAPSPLERWSLPTGWPLPSIWVKRDDLLGEGGTKVRKLKVELARAKAAGHGVVTMGHLDSNHALAAAHFGRALGVSVEAQLLGAPASDPARADRLRAAAAADFHGSQATLVLGTAWSLLRSGGRVRLLPPGGTTVASTAAVALAVAEVVVELAERGEPLPARWAAAVGSGGTLAGLWAGVRALGLPVRPYGAAVSSRWVGPRYVALLANCALGYLGVPERVAPCEVEVDFQTLGGGHGHATAGSTAALEELRAAGHALDPIFTAKAMAGLRQRAQPGEEWLFWHTGRTVE